jgi:hypothetical protein
MMKPFPIVLCVFITVCIVGCSSREQNSIENGDREKVTRANGADEQASQSCVAGAPHALAKPVAALGIRG